MAVGPARGPWSLGRGAAEGRCGQAALRSTTLTWKWLTREIPEGLPGIGQTAQKELAHKTSMSQLKSKHYISFFRFSFHNA